MDASIVTNQQITPLWTAAMDSQADYCGCHFLLFRAEDTMFRIHSECNWEADCMRAAFHDYRQCTTEAMETIGLF